MEQSNVIYLEFTRPDRPAVRDDRPECPNCEGTGITDDDDWRDCPVCCGEGRIDE